MKLADFRRLPISEQARIYGELLDRANEPLHNSMAGAATRAGGTQRRAGRASDGLREIDEQVERLASLIQASDVDAPRRRRWKQQLLKALRPQPRKRGRKIDLKKYAEIVCDLGLLGESVTERTKNNNPAEHKRLIAKKHGLTLRTVDRIQAECSSLSELPDPGSPKRKARIEGLANAVSAALKKQDK